MKKLLLFASVSEAITGLALLIVPALVGELLLGVEIAGSSVPFSRGFGIALIALGVACWPGSKAIRGMVTYSLLASIYLTSVALAGEFMGKLLWPAIVFHIISTFLLIRVWIKLK